MIDKMGRAEVTVEQTNEVKVLLKMGKNQSEIAKLTKTSRCFVQNIAKKMANGKPLVNRPGQGRKRATTSQQDKYFINLSKRNRLKTSRMIASEVNAT